MDLVKVEEDLGTKETILSVFPPFCMKILTESLWLAFQLHIKVCLRVSSVHLDLIGATLILWGRIHFIHLCGVLRIADVATRCN